jgi:hypothetical protein
MTLSNRERPQHTPGPWDFDGCTTMYATPDESDTIVMIEVRANVSECGWDTVAFIESIWPVSSANARLIAAAPELLEALRTLAEQADEDCPAQYRSRHFAEALETAYAIISRATAEQADRRPA